MLWIYSETEKSRYEFDEEFEGVCLRERDKPYEKVIISDSNHEFSLDSAQDRLFAAIADWLERHYGASQRKAV